MHRASLVCEWYAWMFPRNASLSTFLTRFFSWLLSWIQNLIILSHHFISTFPLIISSHHIIATFYLGISSQHFLLMLHPNVLFQNILLTFFFPNILVNVSCENLRWAFPFNSLLLAFPPTISLKLCATNVSSQRFLSFLSQPVATYYGESGSLEFTGNITWPGGSPPRDRPRCGFDNSLCPEATGECRWREAGER